jgi:hypothetical protein
MNHRSTVRTPCPHDGRFLSLVTLGYAVLAVDGSDPASLPAEPDSPVEPQAQEQNASHRGEIHARLPDLKDVLEAERERTDPLVEDDRLLFNSRV